VGSGEGRQHFQDELRGLERSALGGIDLVLEQFDRVLEALEHVDVELAQIVIEDDEVDGELLETYGALLSFTRAKRGR